MIRLGAQAQKTHGSRESNTVKTDIMPCRMQDAWQAKEHHSPSNNSLYGFRLNPHFDIHGLKL
jgi:hypothetical protein